MTRTIARRGRSRLMIGTALAAAAMTVSACGTSGIYSLPLPGGADTGDHPMTITADFADVLNLVPQSSVRVGGVDVGEVESIDLAPDGWSARTELEVRGDVDLPANAVARIEQTNLLGEKFIELDAPSTGPEKGHLEDGDRIPLQHTGRDVQIEEVFGALSLLLNGGGVAQVQPIVQEMNKVLDGRQPQARHMVQQFSELIDGIDDQRNSISAALDSLDTLTSTVTHQRDELDGILDELPKGVRILDEERPEFIELLKKLDHLGKVGSGVVNETRDDILKDLRAIRPTVQALADNVPSLVGALPILPTFPIPDEILQGIQGGYANVWVSLDLRIGETLANLGVGRPDPRYVKPYGEHDVPVDRSNPWIDGNGPRRGWPTVSLLPLTNAAPPFQRTEAGMPVGILGDAADDAADAAGEAARDPGKAVQDGLDAARGAIEDAAPQIGQASVPLDDDQSGQADENAQNGDDAGDERDVDATGGGDH